MKIGILGAGSIGTTLARKLAASGHDVKVANSRGPETIAAAVLETGARAATVEDAARDVDVVILSMPHTGFENVRPLIAALPEQTVVIDTSNYFPQRDGVNPAIEAGQVESEWIQEFFGRPIVKAWNAIGSNPFAEMGQVVGHPDRVAIPIAGDRAQDREVAMTLMDDTGFDGFDAGALADSWRQQPGSPVYCTNLRYDEIAPALAAAERDRLPKRRDLSVAIFAERFGPGVNPDTETIIRISRALQCEAVPSRHAQRAVPTAAQRSHPEGTITMKVGILGTGFMGKNLARKLAAAGHAVKAANSRGPDSIEAEVLETGARAATAEDAVRDVDVVILAMPHPGFEKIRGLISALPEPTVVIDISNYFPGRDPVNPEIEAGKVESEWVREYFGRPITKAWNNIGMVSFETNGRPKGQRGRIALPVAGDRTRDREVAIALINDTGFDGFDAGPLADSWRQQPGSPVYITDLTYDEIGQALASAERDRLPRRRDISAQVFAERVGERASPDAATVVRIARALFM